MCAIAGFIDTTTTPSQHPYSLQKMLDTMVHRGPDDQGVWLSPKHGLGIGHRRLSIVDLTPAGHQPMLGAGKRFIISFNGEIFNHRDLREIFEKQFGQPAGGWQGHSDTETLVACCEAWGVDATLKMAVGQFALALWDIHRGELHLARDRMGEKPLFYGWQGGVFLFASELKALRSHSAFSREIDWSSVGAYLRHNYIPGTSSIYNGISKLKPGTVLCMTRDDINNGRIGTPKDFWSMKSSVERGSAHPFTGQFDDAVSHLHSLIKASVKIQSLADVPVGAFLSGGVDSSLIVALMQSQAASDVRTFSVGFKDSAFDESQHAKNVADHLGTKHIEHILEPADVRELIPKMSEIWDEPFGDSSQLPMMLVSKLAREHVTVALSGDGGDEFFLGYSQYPFFRKIWNSRALGKLPWNRMLGMARSVNPASIASVARAEFLVKLWRAEDPAQLNYMWGDSYRGGCVPMAYPIAASPPIPNGIQFDGAASSAAFFDSMNYLPNDVLVKVDRASMAFSLEARAPLLDHRIVEFAHSLPEHFKLNGKIGKHVLREVLYKYVPEKIVDRPKMGFSIPLAQWLMNELKPWAENLVDEINTSDGIFDDAIVAELWKNHKNGHQDNSARLWSIFNLHTFLKAHNH